MRVIIWTLILGFGLNAPASTPFKRALTVKTNNYLLDGVVTGGRAGGGFSLLNVRRSYSKKAQLERVILETGDRLSRPAGLNMGYFQASLDAKEKRIVVNLAQLNMSLVNEAQIKRIFARSPDVASVEFTVDPEDRSGTMVLNLKHPVKMEVFEVLKQKNPGRVVIDLKPESKRTL